MFQIHFLLPAILAASTAFGQAQDISTTPADTLPSSLSITADEVIVRATRAHKTAPVSQSNLDAAELERLNMGQDVPFVLQWTPSMVVSSDAGTGIGYTYLRIRGSDQTRINVTINGIPLNDAESQQVFWVDLPDFLGSTDQVQIQRGLGASTNGPGAFGATINLNTNKVSSKPGGTATLGGGSFGTWRGRLQAHTGLIAGKYFAEARYSRIHSEGYIDRARADLHSGYFSAGRITDRSLLKLNVFTGKEETYQAWNGVPVQYLDDPDLRRYNTAGTDKPGEPYDSEIDKYDQTHVQLFYTAQAAEDWKLSLAGNYTRGLGFYENYIADDTDFIRRKWLDNHFFGLAPSLQWRTEEDAHSLIVGGGAFQYRGRHFGEALDVQTGELMDELYENDAVKNDANVFVKYTRNFSRQWQLWLDVQQRYVSYSFRGFNRMGEPADQEVEHHFLNPKLGLVFRLDERRNLYGFLGLGHREPNRDDYTESSPLSRPRAERLLNAEFGYRAANEVLSLAANVYGMWYSDQLVETGRLNDVGAVTRINVPKSRRLGVELELAWMPTPRLLFSGTGNLSDNRIAAFTEYIDNWSLIEGPLVVERKNTPISFSPGAVAHGAVRYYLLGRHDKPGDKALAIEWRSKFVGSQYLDNSGEPEARLDAYNFSELQLDLRWPLPGKKSLTARLLVGNILDQELVPSGWIYRFRSAGYNPVPDDPYAARESDDRYQLRGLYPMAGINMQATVQLDF